MILFNKKCIKKKQKITLIKKQKKFIININNNNYNIKLL